MNPSSAAKALNDICVIHEPGMVRRLLQGRSASAPGSADSSGSTAAAMPRPAERLQLVLPNRRWTSARYRSIVAVCPMRNRETKRNNGL